MGLASYDCLIVCGAAACRLPLAGHRLLGWLIGSGMALSTLSVSVQATRAGTGAEKHWKEEQFPTRLSFWWLCNVYLHCCFNQWLPHRVFIVHGIAWLVAVFIFPLSRLWGTPQFRVKISPHRGGRKEERFTWCTSHFTVSWWSSVWLLVSNICCSWSLSPGSFIDSSCLCSLWYCRWLMCFAVLISTACPVKQN